MEYLPVLLTLSWTKFDEKIHIFSYFNYLYFQFVGRGPLTRIKDSKLSRHQVRITWTDQGIQIKQLASNPSYLNTRPLVKVLF